MALEVVSFLPPFNPACDLPHPPHPQQTQPEREPTRGTQDCQPSQTCKSHHAARKSSQHSPSDPQESSQAAVSSNSPPVSKIPTLPMSKRTHRLNPQLRTLPPGHNRLLKRLDPKVIRIPQPRKRQPALLRISSTITRTAQLPQDGIPRAVGGAAQRHGRHAADRVGQRAVLGAAVRAAEEDDGGRGEEDFLEGPVALGFGKAEELWWWRLVFVRLGRYVTVSYTHLTLPTILLV